MKANGGFRLFCPKVVSWAPGGLRSVATGYATAATERRPPVSATLDIQVVKNFETALALTALRKEI